MSLLPAPPSFPKKYREEMIRIVKEALNDAGAYNTCINCRNFDEPTEQCSQFKCRPPARVIAFGCSAFDEDEGK